MGQAAWFLRPLQFWRRASRTSGEWQWIAAPTLSVGALQSYPPCIPDLALSASMLPEFSLRQTRLEGVSEGPISFIQGAEAQRAGLTYPLCIFHVTLALGELEPL